MSKITFILSIALAFLFSGCGYLVNSLYDNEDFARKTASALNTTYDKIEVSNRKAGLFYVDFIATTGKGKQEKSYKCKVDADGTVVSDASCSSAIASKDMKK